jgi:hypothetical protein
MSKNAEPMPQYGAQQIEDYKKRLLSNLDGSDDKTDTKDKIKNKTVPFSVINFYNHIK